MSTKIRAAQTKGTAAVFAALMVVCAAASAEESKTDFDQKIDAARLAADLGSKTLQDISPVTDLPQVAPPPNFRIGRDKAARAQDYGLSHFQSQFQQQSAPVIDQLLHARSDKRYQAMPQVKRRPLDDGFSSVQDERQRILQDAGQLDTRDQSLKTESDYIRINKPLLDERRLKVNADIAAWNRDCGGSSHPNGLPPAQYQECMRRDSALRPVRDQFNRDNDAMNSRIVSYNASYEQMKKDVGTASDWWSSWGDRAAKLLERIFASFASRKVECTYVAKSTGGLCIYNCDEIGITNLMPDQDDGGCSKTRYIDPDDIGGGAGVMSTHGQGNEKSK